MVKFFENSWNSMVRRLKVPIIVIVLAWTGYVAQNFKNIKPLSQAEKYFQPSNRFNVLKDEMSVAFKQS